MARPPSPAHGGDVDVSDPQRDEPGLIDAHVARTREDARRLLAISLVAIFGVEVVAALLTVLCGRDLATIKDILTIILGPTVALVGSATGFYFGTKADNNHHSGARSRG
jgi:hypothetical protein